MHYTLKIAYSVSCKPCFAKPLRLRVRLRFRDLLRKSLSRVVVCFTFRMLETSYAYVIYFVNHYRVSKFALQTS